MPTPLTDDQLRRLANDPERLAKYQAKLTSDERRRMGQFPQTVKDTVAPVASATARFLSPIVNAPLDMAKFAVGVVTDPWNNFETARGMLDASANQLELARQAEAKGQPGEGLLRRVASVPLIGPALADVVDTARSGDVAGAAGKGVVLAGPAAVKGVRAAGGAATDLALKGGKTVAPDLMERGAAALDAGATERMAKFMSPQTGPNKARFANQAVEVAPELLRDPDLSAISRGGLASKIADRLDQAEQAIDAATNDRLVSQQVKTAPLLARLDEMIDRLTAKPVEASKITPKKTNLNADGEETVLTRSKAEPFGSSIVPDPNSAQVLTLRRIRKELAALGEVAPYESVRRIREAWDKVAKLRYMPSTQADALKAQGDSTAAYKATSAMREALADTDPKSAAAYKAYSLNRTANDVLAATEEAERVRPNRGRGLTQKLMAMQGVPGLVAAIVDKAAEYSPTYQVALARRMAAAADAIRAGNTSQAQSILTRAKAQVDGMAKRAVKGVAKNSATLGHLSDLGRIPVAAENRQDQQP